MVFTSLVVVLRPLGPGAGAGEATTSFRCFYAGRWAYLNCALPFRALTENVVRASFLVYLLGMASLNVPSINWQPGRDGRSELLHFYLQALTSSEGAYIQDVSYGSGGCVEVWLSGCGENELPAYFRLWADGSGSFIGGKKDRLTPDECRRIERACEVAGYYVF